MTYEKTVPCRKLSSIGQNGPAYLALKQRGDIDQAAEAFRRAQALHEASMMFQAASQATRPPPLAPATGKHCCSVEKLPSALRLAPNFAVAHYQLGLALHEKHEGAQAAAEFDKAYQLEPRIHFAGATTRLPVLLHRPTTAPIVCFAW
jgi:tetratricopeptide (TPR) repeat protein